MDDGVSERIMAAGGGGQVLVAYAMSTVRVATGRRLLEAQRRWAPQWGRFSVRCCTSAVEREKRKVVARGDLTWAPLHTHTDFSFLDGASHVPDLAKQASQMGIPAIAITDHGNMHGAIQHLMACRMNGVKPILGNEMYILNGDIAEDGYKGIVHHLTVMSKNSVGYKNLVKLTSISHMKGFRSRNRSKRPAINKELLEQYKEGLIVLSGCLAGEIPKALVADRYDVARNVARWYQDTFGEDFYLEMMDHGLPMDKIVNQGVMKLSKELGIKTVVSNDSHFTKKSDCVAHDALLCIQTGKLLQDTNRMKYTGTEYFKSADEMMDLFNDMDIEKAEIQKSLENTIEIANKVEEYDILNEPQIPTYPLPEGWNGTVEEYFRAKTLEGLEARFKNRGGITDEYKERLEYEIQLLIDKGFPSYFLIVWDYIRFARENGVSVGPGRGSACGSLVAYALRITDIDPVEHKLLFERFLNPERKSLPDIDTDFSMEGREKVIKYVVDKYGEDRVAQIVTFNRLSSRAVLRDVSRVMGVPLNDALNATKMIPVMRGKPTKLDVLISDQTPSKEFQQLYKKDKTFKEVIDVALVLEGTNRNSGVHAAGVVIGAEPLDNVVPLMMSKNDEVITQYAMEDLEAVGLLKMDFLGLRNLSVIDSTREYVEKKFDKTLPSLEELNFDDRKTYDLLASGKVDGVFQLDASTGMQEIVQKLGPNNLADISSILALYRPGPLDAGLVNSFIKRKHGQEAVSYEHPQLEKILESTYGVLVYQEQIMQVARDLAGYSLGQADILRKSMGKKKMDIMQMERGRFVSGAVKKGIDKKIAESLFDQMLRFAEYCFNKSHSTAYAYLTYHTAWLKANYPVEFMASVLRLNSDNMTKLPRYIEDASAQGVVVLAPSVNTSQVEFAPVYKIPEGVNPPPARNGYVGFGLGAVKGVGALAAEYVTDERNENGSYSSIFDFCCRLPMKNAGKRVLDSLVRCGAFDELHGNRKAVMESIPDIVEWRKKLDAKRKRAAASDKADPLLSYRWQDDPTVEGIISSWAESDYYSPIEKYAAEKELIGFFASGNLHDQYEEKVRFLLPWKLEEVVGSQKESQKEEYDEETDSDQRVPKNSGITFEEGDVGLFFGIVTDEKKMYVKGDGKAMSKFTLQDVSGECQCVAFPRTYQRSGDLFTVGTPLCVTAQVKDNSRPELIVHQAQKLDDAMVSVVYIMEDNLSSSKAHDLQVRFNSAMDALHQLRGNNLMTVRVAIVQRVEGEYDVLKRTARVKKFFTVPHAAAVSRVFKVFGLHATVCRVAEMKELENDPQQRQLENMAVNSNPEMLVHERT